MGHAGKLSYFRASQIFTHYFTTLANFLKIWRLEIFTLEKRGGVFKIFEIGTQIIGVLNGYPPQISSIISLIFLLILQNFTNFWDMREIPTIFEFLHFHSLFQNFHEFSKKFPSIASNNNLTTSLRINWNNSMRVQPIDSKTNDVMV